MTEGVATPSDAEAAAAARASEQARLRKQRREAKIKAGGASRLDKITGLGGGIPKDPPSTQPSGASTPSPPAATPSSDDHHADPDEVDISQHFSTPQSTARPPPAFPDPSNMSEAQLRQMMLSFERPSSGPGDSPGGGRNPFMGGAPPMTGMEGMENINSDPMLQMFSKMMGAGGPDGSGGGNPFAGMEGLFNGAGGANPFQQQPQQQTPQSKNANIWRILHAMLALGLGIYVAFTTTFTGTKVERETDDLQATGVLGVSGPQDIMQARAWFFYIFTSVEAVLLSSRFMLQRTQGFQPSGIPWTVSGMLPDPYKGYIQHALRYAEIFTTVRNDALFCVFVMGVCCLIRS
ncbi:hypothetical protein F5Y16DRAFT_403422 [Xylariaceae sp. FL0255]|nr:hypothetical protein F5Y16DRAFT_403422 [Xylariaceae sp. FL0255]